MARSMLGGGVGDQVFGEILLGRRTVYGELTDTNGDEASVTLQAYSAPTLASTHYEDLLDADENPITEVTTTAGSGYVPVFYTPDDVEELWLTADGVHFFRFAVGPVGPVGPAGADGGTDEATAEWVGTGALTGPAVDTRVSDKVAADLPATGTAIGAAVDEAVELLIEDTTPSLTRAALDATMAPAINVRAHGATGDGTTDDTTAIQAAIDAAEAIGGTLYFPAGTYVVTGITSDTGIRWVGEGYRKTIIQSATGDVLTLSGNFHAFENLHFKGRPGGGHAVVVPPGGVLSQSQFSMCQFTSQNDAKSTWLYTSVSSTGGGIFDVHWIDCYFLHTATSTVPGFDVYGDNNVFSANRFTRCRAQLCGTAPFWSIVADGVSLSNYNNVWDTINFETTNGGGIHCKSATNFAILNPGFFDMGTIVGDLLRFDRVATRPQSRGANIFNYHRSGGTLSGGAKDVHLVAGGNAGTCNIYGIGGPSGAGVTIDLGSTVGFASVLGYDPSNVTIQNATTSTVLLTGQSGIQTGKLTLKPATGAALPTVTTGIGTPEGAVTAAVGSLHTRTDGGAATTLYVKESGAGNTGWVAK